MSRYLSFCLDFLIIYRKGLINKINVNVKFCDVTAWLTSNCNTHITQYFEMFDFVFGVYLLIMIYWTSTEVLLNLVAPLDSAVPSFDFDQINAFELPVLISLLLYLIRSVSAEVSLSCISRILCECLFFWPWENQYMVHDFDFINITQFPAIIFSVSAKGSLNRVAHSI